MIHEGHRARMRERFLEIEGFDGFSDFELFETLLYYSKPRGDTNPCAHALMERFGSVKQVIDASVDELCGVDGMGLHSATLIKLMGELMRRYRKDMVQKAQSYARMSLVVDYLSPLFLGLAHERLYMLMFNDRMNLIDCVLISRGSINSTDVQLRLMLEKIIAKKATAVILAHNHPNGVAIPSECDVTVTDQIKTTFEAIHVTLVEHFIISDTYFWPIMRRHYGMFRPSPIITGDRTESYFYETFYDLEEEDYKLHFSFDPPSK